MTAMKPLMTSVLVVGDDESLRSEVAASLHDGGFAVEATSSENALDLRHTQANPPRLIVLDAGMSDAARSKFLSATRHTKPPIVALSCKTELRSIVSQDGVWLCLAKPIAMDVLVHAVGRITSFTAARAA
jgi:DNA-binding response OmpR family regulator